MKMFQVQQLILKILCDKKWLNTDSTKKRSNLKLWFLLHTSAKFTSFIEGHIFIDTYKDVTQYYREDDHSISPYHSN